MRISIYVYTVYRIYISVYLKLRKHMIIKILESLSLKTKFIFYKLFFSSNNRYI